MRWHTSYIASAIVGMTFALYGNAQEAESKQTDPYDVLLHSRVLTDQRTALAAIMREPQRFVPRIQRSLRDYPHLLRTDRSAANRAVYVSALVRDPSFAPILAKELAYTTILEECEYPCPIVFALTIQASFAGWKLPRNLDSQLSTVVDLRNSIRSISHLTLKVEPIDSVVQGPMLEEHRTEIKGKTEEQLIRMASPATKSLGTRYFATYRLETLVTDSRNRNELYLLALNEIRDASGDYRDAIYHAIYRAEIAKARSESVAPRQ